MIIGIRRQSNAYILSVELKLAMGYLKEIQKHGRNANPFFRFMDIDLISFDGGKAELNMEIQPCMLNGAGWMQGGLLAALCDEAMALALFTILDDNDSIATINESTSFLQGIKDGKIMATGQVIKIGNRIAFTEGWITSSANCGMLSRSTAAYAIIKPF